MINKFYDKTKSFIKENSYFLIGLIIGLIIINIELPLVIEVPGGSVDLKERIIVKDAYKTKGSLEMSYVTMVKGKIPLVLLSFIIPNWDLVSTNDIKYDNETIEEMYKRDELMLKEANNNAIINAFTYANKEIEIKKEITSIIYIDDQANTELEIGDEIISIEGKKINSTNDLRNILKTKKDQDIVTTLIKRDGKEQTVNSTIFLVDNEPKIGIMILTTYELDTEIPVEIKTKPGEYGPSGGLMTSLSIYNALVKEDITQGKKIVGTGTIDKEGNIGEIGGVKYKILGAVNSDTDIFITPKENYEEALKVKKDNDLDIEIITGDTFEDIVNILTKK